MTIDITKKLKFDLSNWENQSRFNIKKDRYHKSVICFCNSFCFLSFQIFYDNDQIDKLVSFYPLFNSNS